MFVFTVKVALVEPEGTVTLAGTVAAGLLLVRETTAPPAAAGFVRVTVPWALLPPSTLLGFKSNDKTPGGAVAPN